MPTTVNSPIMSSFSSSESRVRTFPTQSLSPVKLLVSITAHSPLFSGSRPSSKAGVYISGAPSGGRVCIRAVWVSPSSESSTVSVS